MKAVFWLLVLFAVAIAATLAAKNNGYVLVVAQPYRIELSLNLMALLLSLAFVVIYLFVRLGAMTLRLPAEVSEFRLRRRRDKAHKAMLEGFKAFLEGRYDKAEKASAAALEMKESSVVNVLNAVVAARSAHELGRFSERDEFIALAEAGAPKEAALRLMTQAELLLDQHRSEEALHVLQALSSAEKRKHNASLWLEIRAYQQLGNWKEVLNLLGQMEQRNALDKTLLRKLRHRAHVRNLKSSMSDASALEEYWRGVPLADKEDSKLVVAIVHACVAAGECAAARQIIEESLDRHWDAELAQLYGECPAENAIGQLERAETWLESQPNDARLLLALGKLCINRGLWGKAQNYLDASLSVEPGYSAHLALAQLNEKIGQTQLANDHYEKGMALALSRLKVLEQKHLLDNNEWNGDLLGSHPGSHIPNSSMR
jgi:HemY protein